MCSAAIAAYAQSSAPSGSGTGSITGTLFDSIGDPVDNNAVQAKNTESGAIFKATTSATGKYTLADLPPGAYDVSGSAPGLTAFEKKGVVVASLPNRVARPSPRRHHAAQHARRRSLANNRRHETPRTAFRPDAAHRRTASPIFPASGGSPAPSIPANPNFFRPRSPFRNSAATPTARTARRRIACLPARCATVHYGSSSRARTFWSTFPTTKAPASIRFIWTAAAIPPIPIRPGTGIPSAVGTATRWSWIASAFDPRVWLDHRIAPALGQTAHRRALPSPRSRPS